MRRTGGVRRTLLLPLFAAVCLLLGGFSSASAQSLHLDLDLVDVPLAEALVRVGELAHIDVVFTRYLVDGRRVNCRYTGASAGDALGCVLRGSGLAVKPLRDRQYVLVRAPGSSAPASAVAMPPSGLVALHGRVVDAETGEALAGSHIFLPLPERGAAADSEGSFTIEALAPGEHLVRVSFVGYEPVDVRLSTARKDTVRLAPTSLQAGEIVVESSRGVTEAVEVVPGVEAVLAHRSEQSPSFLAEDDLFQRLNSLPGVRQSGELSGHLLVRGSGPNENLYLLDGAPLYHPWHAMGLFSTVQTEVLQRAQLYKGSLPPEFGGRLSAVLDMQLKDGNGVEPEVQAGLSTQSAQMMLETPLGSSASLMLGARRAYADGLLGGVQQPGQLTLQGSAYYDLSAKITVRPRPGHELRLTAYRAGDRLPPDGAFSHEGLGWNRYARVDDPLATSRYRWSNGLLNVQHSYLHGPRLLVTSSAYLSSYVAQDKPDNEAPADLNYTMRVADLGLKVDADYFRSARHTLRAGAHLVFHRFRNAPGDAAAWPVGLPALLQREAGLRLGALEAAFYVQDNWQATPRLLLQPGLRLSAFSTRLDMHAMPRLNARWVARPDWLVLNAGVSRQVQYVHQVRDRYAAAYGLSASRWVSVAARGVEPASGWQVALGLESRPTRALHLSLDVYGRDFRDVLIPQAAYDASEEADDLFADVSVLQRYALGTQRAYGVEATLRYGFRTWQAWTSYAGGRSLARPYDIEAAPHPTQYDVPHSLRVGVERTRRHWAFSLLGEVRSGYPVAPSNIGAAEAEPAPLTWAADADPPVLTDELERLPTYARVDARVGYRFELVEARWNLQLHLFNLTGRRNVVGHVFDLNRPEAARQDLIGVPRLPLFKMQVAF